MCFLNTKFFPIGGTAIRTLNFARAIKDRKNGVRIITWQPTDDYPDEKKVSDLVREGICVDIAKVNHQVLKKHFRFLYVLSLGLQYSIFVGKIVKEEETDVVHCVNETIWIGALIKKILKKPVVADIHATPSIAVDDFLPAAKNVLPQFLSKTALRIAAKFIDGFMCPTEELRDLLISWGLPSRKVKTITNAMFIPENLKKSKAKIRAELGLDEETTLIAFHGNLTTHYNIDALRCLSRISRIVSKDLRKVKFLVMGYYEKVPVADANFIYTGYVEDLRGYINAADFAVVPIFENSLGIRSRLLDYFAMSIPVLTTPVGVTGMKFAQESGAVIVRNNIEELAQSTVELASSQEKIKEMAEKSRKLIKWFSPERTARILLSFYSQVIQEWQSHHK